MIMVGVLIVTKLELKLRLAFGMETLERLENRLREFSSLIST